MITFTQLFKKRGQILNRLRDKYTKKVEYSKKYTGHKKFTQHLYKYIYIFKIFVCIKLKMYHNLIRLHSSLSTQKIQFPSSSSTKKNT